MVDSEVLLQDQFEWSKAIETGNQIIDTDHMKLLKMIEQLRDMTSGDEPLDDPVVVTTIIKEMKDYASFHFANEDSIMDTFDYDDRNLHKRAHAAFLKKVQGLDGNIALTSSARQSLVKFLFDWLVNHICSIDQVMVAKMECLDGDVVSMLNNQTALVIDHAYTIAENLSQMSDLLKGQMTDEHRRELRGAISSGSERLLNLVSLAETRIGLWGGSELQLKRMASVRSAVTGSVCSLMEQYATKVIEYGEKALSGASGIPFGCGATISRWILSILSLTEMVGEAEFLTPEQSYSIVHAFEIANSILELEVEHLNQKEFGKNVPPLHRFEVPAAIITKAYSQQDVLKGTNTATRQV